MKESARYILQILVFVALILSIGTGGYLIIEDGITVGDAFYVTVTAITPTQFDEIHKLSVPGRYFTVVLVFCGFGAVVAFGLLWMRYGLRVIAITRAYEDMPEGEEPPGTRRRFGRWHRRR